jgi:hypothetical protein
MALVDATSVNMAIREVIDYTPVIEMALTAAEATLGLPTGTLGRRSAVNGDPERAVTERPDPAVTEEA